ncbi:MAG: M90 family metallopeptidase [Pseudomonadota bacterium]
MAGILRSLFGRPAPLPIPDAADWRGALGLPLFVGLPDTDRAALKALAEELLASRTFTPVSGAAPTGLDLAAIAAQAALPVLRLGAGWYGTWNEVILYPEQFVPEREITDDFGIVHRVRQPLSGEAWEGGPLILSLDDVAASGWRDGYNVVIHEFAHKLDMKNGAVDGLPPLHGDMDPLAWAAAFGPAYDDFCRRADAFDAGGPEPLIDPYAAESPAEFFAVLSEYFFELPHLLAAEYPAVHGQLARFYRQDPLSRLEPTSHDPATS